MNKTTIGLISCSALAMLAFSGSGQNREQFQHEHAVVLLTAYPGSIQKYAGTNWVTEYNGAQVWISSSSTNAPHFPQGVFGSNDNSQLVELADAIKILLDQGFQITHVDPTGFTYTLVK